MTTTDQRKDHALTKLNDPANELRDPNLKLKTYIVTVDTPTERLDVEVPTFLGAAAAKRRAQAMLFMNRRAGDLDDYVVLDCVEGAFPEPRE